MEDLALVKSSGFVVIIMIVMVIMVIMIIMVIRVASVKSSIGIFTHQGHISQVSENAYSVSNEHR